MRLFYHDSHYALIRLKKGAQPVEDTKLALPSGNLEEGESNPCDAHSDCEFTQGMEGLTVKSPNQVAPELW